MPRFKVVDYSPRFLPVDLTRQLLPGTFEYALHHLLDNEIDLSEIESRYCNDEVGASAYEPRILLKIVLLAYSHGIVSSRGMQWACRDNVQFIALSGDSQPDHSTLATFVSHLWVIRFATRASGGRKLASTNRVWWSGNDRLTNRLNVRTRRTKLLRVNAIPSRMDRNDLLKAFDVAIAALHFFETRGANRVEILRDTISFQGTKMPFLLLREELANAL